jgi:hypothetical protein
MPDDCVHAWACPGPVPVPQQANQIAIVLPLYCTKCAAVMTKVAPPPEPEPQHKIARAQFVPQGMPAPVQRR